jgi:hypothetical protein
MQIVLTGKSRAGQAMPRRLVANCGYSSTDPSSQRLARKKSFFNFSPRV